MKTKLLRDEKGRFISNKQKGEKLENIIIDGTVYHMPKPIYIPKNVTDAGQIALIVIAQLVNYLYEKSNR